MQPHVLSNVAMLAVTALITQPQPAKVVSLANAVLTALRTDIEAVLRVVHLVLSVVTDE